MLQNGCKRITIPSGSPIKTVPTEPKDKATKSTECNRMAGYRVYFLNLTGFVFYILAKSGTNHNRTNQCSDTTNRVNCCRACKVVETELRKPSLRIPYPTPSLSTHIHTYLITHTLGRECLFCSPLYLQRVSQCLRYTLCLIKNH